MNTVVETLVTPVKYEYDVVVAGGGVAGIAAALAAARQGARVALLEKQFMLGGLATAGLVTIYLPLCDGEGHQVSFGIAEELFHLSIKYGAESEYPTPWLENGSMEEKKKTRFQVRYNAQLFAIAAEQLLRKEGVTIFYGTSVCAATTTENKITSLIIENKSGRSAVRVSSVVDATGDADLCVLSGEETELFQQKNILAAWYYDSTTSGYSLNMLGYADIPEEEKTEDRIKEDAGRRRFQGIDNDELSEMVCLSHDAVLGDLLAKREKDPQIMPVTIATIPQVRMTRRIAGVYTMSVSDERKEWSDSIGIISNWKKRGPVYEIPFRCLYGNKIKNLITAGRCISANDPMWDVTRVIPACAVTGQAAGVAAAQTDDYSSIDIELLQKHLREAGVVLHYNELKWD